MTAKLLKLKTSESGRGYAQGTGTIRYPWRFELNIYINVTFKFSQLYLVKKKTIHGLFVYISQTGIKNFGDFN